MLVGADEQELGAPRVGRRRLGEGQRDCRWRARLTRSATPGRSSGAGPTSVNPVPSRSYRDEPSGSHSCGSRAPGLGRGRVAGHVGHRGRPGGGLDDRRAGVGVAQDEPEAVELGPLRALDGLLVAGQVAGQAAHVGLRAGHGLLDHASAFWLVAAEQAGRRPALLDRGDLPGHVDGVPDAGVEAVAAPGRVHMGALADQEHPPVPEAVAISMRAVHGSEASTSWSTGAPTRPVISSEACAIP